MGQQCDTFVKNGGPQKISRDRIRSKRRTLSPPKPPPGGWIPHLLAPAPKKRFARRLKSPALPVIRHAPIKPLCSLPLSPSDSPHPSSISSKHMINVQRCGSASRHYRFRFQISNSDLDFEFRVFRSRSQISNFREKTKLRVFFDKFRITN